MAGGLTSEALKGDIHVFGVFVAGQFRDLLQRRAQARGGDDCISRLQDFGAPSRVRSRRGGPGGEFR